MRFRCLGHEFTVAADREEDRALVVEGLAPFAVDPDGPGSDEGTVVHYELRPTATGQYGMYIDGRNARASGNPDEPLDVLFWNIADGAVRSERRAFLLHSGAVVATDGRALLLPGMSGSGKSTTTLALVRAGLGYLSDEVAVIDPDDATVTAFPRPVAIKAGSRQLWPDLHDFAPRVPDDPIWTVHVPASRLGALVPDTAIDVGWVVFPRYAGGSPTALEPMSPGETCIELVRSTFGHQGRAVACLTTMARVARGARGYRMSIGDLREAVDLLTGLTEPGGAMGTQDNDVRAPLS